MSTIAFAAPIEVRPNAWLSRPGRTRRLAQVALAGALLTVAMSFGLHTTENRLGFLVLMLPPWLLGAWCVHRTGLWLGPDGVVVRGFLRTYEVPLSQAKSFSPGIHGWVGNGYPSPALERVDASAIPIFCFGREGVVWKLGAYLEELRPVCDELNALLHQLQAEAEG